MAENSDYTRRDRWLKRWSILKAEREPFVPRWLELSERITPASGRFFSTRRNNQASDRWNRIYNNTATRAANILAAGLMSGMTDPSSQWFALTTGSPDLDENYAVKQYLDMVQRILEMAFTRTNTYQALHHGWREVGVYGVTADIIIEDPMDGFHHYPLVAGEYCLACNHRYEPDTLYRRFYMTAAQIVQKYGREKCGRAVAMAADGADWDRKFKVLHIIEPRLDRDPNKRSNRHMPWQSIVLLIDGDDSSDGVLEESGYNEFPCVVGRWGANATDVYSEESPGIIAIGDVLQLQHQELQKGNAIDYAVDPPLILPVNARSSEVDFLPGGRSYIDTPGQGNQVYPARQVQLDINAVRQDITEVQNRINQAFNVDMFLMLSQRTNQMTATEVAERHEEKLMMLGPVLSRLNYEVLRVLIERCYSILNRAGQLPPPPDELRGQVLNIEYTSMLARSQRAVRASSLDNFLARVGQVAQFDPTAIKKLNTMQIIDEYADYYSVSPGCIVPTDEAMAAIQAEQQAQAQAAQQQQMMAGADAMSKLGRVPADDSTMAGALMKGMQGAMMQGAPGGPEPEAMGSM